MVSKIFGIFCIVFGCIGLAIQFYRMSKSSDTSGKEVDIKITRDDHLKSEMQSVLDKASETLDYEIGLLRCLNPMSDKLRDILLSIEKFGTSTKYPFKDPELEKKKIALLNLCADLRARFTGYDKDEAQKLGERNLESGRLVNEFEIVLREFVQRLNA